jgi:hypothetical protein
VRIGENARKCVIFFGVPTPEKPIEYAGTGFLVNYHEQNLPFGFLVTARHVASALQKHEDTGFTLRMNRKGGSSTQIITEAPWRFHPDETVDVAASPITIPADADQVFYELEDDNVVDYEKINNDVICGDIINIVGLFRLHAGSQRNVPIVHTGNIAALPDAVERVPMRDRVTNQLVETEAYLIEAQTLEGLSGSPVFVHSIWSLGSYPMREGTHPRVLGGVKLLGLYSGAWDGEPGTILAADRNLSGGKRVPVGMGIVVPAKKIVELIRDDPEFKSGRQKIIRDNSGRNA